MIIEKRKNIVFEASEIFSLAKSFSIKKIFEIDLNNIKESLFIVNKAGLDKSDQLVTFFIFNGVNSDNQNQISKYLSENNPKIKIQITNIIREVDINSKLILVASLGSTKIDEFMEVHEKFLLLNKKPDGLVFFNQSSKKNYST